MIFNKNNNGNKELKDILGFIYASNSFENIKNDIHLAEFDLKSIIGKNIFERALEHYESDDYDNSSDEDETILLNNQLVAKIQAPLAYFAYKMYANNADLTHSDKGRQILVTENEKPAFEWQIEKDDNALQLKAFKSLDILFDFLNTNINKFNEWKESEQYQMSCSRFINSAIEFNKYYPINNSSSFYYRIISFISECERKYILPILGEELYNSLKEKIANEFSKPEEIPDEDEELYLTDSDKILLNYINIPLSLYSIAISVRRLSVDLLENGIYHNIVSSLNTIKNKAAASLEVKFQFIKNLEDEALAGISFLSSYLEKLDNEDSGLSYDPAEITDRMTEDNLYFRM